MAAVPSERTSLEQRLASAMWAVGVRGWRRRTRVEASRPDFVFTRQRVAVFADGCFWHGCPHCARRPTANADYWHRKLDRNLERDSEQSKRLKAAGWTVVRFWGHEIQRDPSGCAQRVAMALGATFAVKKPSG
jgi:DNA mismatch endonuclease (patch repair protein)